MPKQESTLSKVCNITRGMVPFCLDLDDKDSYVIDISDSEIDDALKKSDND